ncbi:MAG: MBL fold metallo-hydrolase [Halobacteriales archaeon]|nr:MBL fold metallo-hydrolase [Halobacteriales archaeon]
MERIALGNREFEGRNNAYLLVGDDEVALLDTAVATEEAREQLVAALAELGYGFDDIDTLVLTHWHYDHAGLAGEIQAAGGATVYAHADDAPLISHDEAAIAALRDRQFRRMTEWGMPEDKRSSLEGFMTASLETAGGAPVDVEPVADGEVLAVAGRRLEVVHVPGHTAGLSAFAIDDGAEAFVGDAVLPVYTPNIGGADVRVEAPLSTYAASLERLIDRGFDRVWPGHRDPIDAPADRARTILDHHRDRTQRVLDVLAEHGPADAWTVSAHLFGDLESIHIMHGPGEAWAHLDHLERHGVVGRDDAGYRLVDGSAAVEPPPLS